MKKEILIKIWGRVQGVFFRATAKEAADKLALFGYVSNCPDGTVELCILGTQEEANHLLEEISSLNKRIRIDQIEQNERAATENFSSFEIR